GAAGQQHAADAVDGAQRDLAALHVLALRVDAADARTARRGIAKQRHLHVVEGGVARHRVGYRLTDAVAHQDLELGGRVATRALHIDRRQRRIDLYRSRKTGDRADDVEHQRGGDDLLVLRIL